MPTITRYPSTPSAPIAHRRGICRAPRETGPEIFVRQVRQRPSPRLPTPEMRGCGGLTAPAHSSALVLHFFIHLFFHFIVRLSPSSISHLLHLVVSVI